MSTQIFHQETKKIPSCRKYKTQSGEIKIYKSTGNYTYALTKIEKFFNDNPDKYETFKKRISVISNELDRIRILESITNYSKTACKKFISDHL